MWTRDDNAGEAVSERLAYALSALARTHADGSGLTTQRSRLSITAKSWRLMGGALRVAGRCCGQGYGGWEAIPQNFGVPGSQALRVSCCRALV